VTVHIPWLLDVVVAAFEQHLHDARGLRDSTSAAYARHARRFSRAALGADPIDIGRLAPSDVLEYIIRSTEGLHPKTVLSIEAALRSFFRFLRVEGLSDGRLEDALPSVAQRRFASLPRGGILTEEELARLLASAAASKYPARDRAIVTCFAGLGLRPGDVADLRLDDIDWRAGTLRVVAHKTRRERVLPLPREVGRAIVAYIRTERPKTSERRVFVHHREQVRGGPLTSRDVSRVVAEALRRADIVVPGRGAYVLRHTLASRMVRRGTSLKEVADFMGHRSLETTMVYAKLDLPALREVALPWPEVTP